jgi:proline dehydrogenase
LNLLDKFIVSTFPLIPKSIVGRISSRYIAGDQVKDAMRVIQKFNHEKFLATVDILGEHVSLREEATKVSEDYVHLLDSIEENKLDCNISIKLTHLGLKLDYDFCKDNVRRLVSAAKEKNNFIRIDMEDSTCTDDTLRLYRELREDFDNVGVAIQSYLRRTLKDIRHLMDSGMKINVRLCKGIYVEERSIAFKDKEIINRNYTLLLKELLSRKMYVGIATHDEQLVWEAFRLIDEFKLAPHEYEFQMLLGVDAHLRRVIRDAGHRLRVYVPFGSQWYDYSVRRLKENPQIARYVLKNMLNRSKD